jgi:hypothetical protein
VALAERARVAAVQGPEAIFEELGAAEETDNARHEEPSGDR